MLQAIVLGTLVIVLLGIGLTLSRMRSGRDDRQEEAERG
jgi:hypothetical protein